MNATEAYDAELDLVLIKTPVVIVINRNTENIRAIDRSISGRRPYIAGRKAKPTEQARENICEVALMSVVLTCSVIPAFFNIAPR